MLDMFRKFFNSFRKNPDIWFFYAFLITSTLSVRKVLFYYPINNTFNEYTGIYLYLSDIFLFLTLITWLLTLCNKKYTLSMYNLASSFIKIVPRGTIWHPKKAYQQVVHNYILIFPLFIAFFSFLSILWANNLQIALFKSFKLFEFALLFLYVYKLFHACPVAEKCSTWNISLASGVEHFHQNKLFIKRIFQIIIGASIIQSIIGITQFFIQQSIGLTWLRESFISPNIPGVAKTIFNGHTYIRAYGLFPHPNIFGGFLVFSVLTSILYFKLFHVEQFDKVKQCIKKISYLKIVPRGTMLMPIIILIQGLALLLTFSRSAIIGLFIGLFYLYTKKCSTPEQMFHVEHYTGRAWNIFSDFKKKHVYKKLFLIAGILFLSLLILKPDTYSILFKSLRERAFYLNVSRGTFLSNPLIGVGSGQFVLKMQDINNIQPWQFQPVHNVFLLVLNEFGIIIFFMFLYFIYKLFHPSINVPRGTFYEAGVEQFITTNTIRVYFKAILLSFTFIMLFDHYFWDIQQGQILFWLLFGFIASRIKNNSLT